MRVKESIQVGAAIVVVLVGALACKRGAATSDAGSTTSITTSTSTSTSAVEPEPTASVAAAPEKSVYKVGDKITVLWKGSPYPCTVLAVQPNDKYKIHYTGYGAEWDESVGLDRIVGAKTGVAPTAKPKPTGGGGGGGGSAADAPCPGPGITRRCNGVCVNLQTDDNNCGSCGTVCSGGKHCDGHLFCRDSEGNL